MTEHTATVTRDGKWWMIHVDGIGVTQARRLSEVELMARELIAVTLDADVETVAVRTVIESVGPVPGVAERVAAIRAERDQAAKLERQASADAAKLARDLAAADIPVRDIGEVLGVSYQRAHQLISA